MQPEDRQYVAAVESTRAASNRHTEHGADLLSRLTEMACAKSIPQHFGPHRQGLADAAATGACHQHQLDINTGNDNKHTRQSASECCCKRVWSDPQSSTQTKGCVGGRQVTADNISHLQHMNSTHDQHKLWHSQHREPASGIQVNPCRRPRV